MGDAIKNWGLALSDDFPLDKATFLVASLMPIAYMEPYRGETLIVVDLDDIREHTKHVKLGCDFLVSQGLARWHAPTKDIPQTLSLGTVMNFVDNKYYFQNSKRLTNMVKNRNNQEEDDFMSKYANVISELDQTFERYKEFCNKAHISARAEKVHGKVKALFKKLPEYTLTPTDLLMYLDCVNAMYNDWKDVPDRYSNFKEKAVAKKIVMKHTTEDIIKAVPYFVENYHEFAREGYEDTNIYMLSFQIGLCLRKMGTKERKLKKPRSYEKDDL